jgi:uncharacterized protein YlxW (UPF0749 family)
MSLLVDMMTNTLDPGYAEAAARRAARAESSGPPSGEKGKLTGRRLAALVAAGLAGLILVTAAEEARRSAPALAKTKADLVTQVKARTDQVAALQRQVTTLSDTLAQLRGVGLAGSATGRNLSSQLGRLQVATGGIPVSGPAVKVTLSDAPLPANAIDPAKAVSGGQVLDSDLQHVVNALWASGAEAIAVNGQRVTELTSIRAAGDAIVVDFRPVDPPYVVTAIGDPDALQQSFVSSSAAAALRTYSQAYGLGFTVKGVAGVTLPAASAPQLYAAQAGASPEPASPPPSAGPTGGTS